MTNDGRRVLAMIPARGGSKGIPRKNIKELGGKPLIAWTIECALAVESIDTVIVSTEDEETAAVAKHYGALVPFMRPEQLATDKSPGIDVDIHALNLLPDHDIIVRLQPTSPFRNPVDIEESIALSQKYQAPVVTVTESPKPPEWLYRFAQDDCIAPILEKPLLHTNRQDITAAYVLNGAVYVVAKEYLLEHKSYLTQETRAYVMPRERSLDIDSIDDWLFAECLLNKSGNPG